LWYQKLHKKGIGGIGATQLNWNLEVTTKYNESKIYVANMMDSFSVDHNVDIYLKPQGRIETRLI